MYACGLLTWLGAVCSANITMITSSNVRLIPNNALLHFKVVLGHVAANSEINANISEMMQDTDIVSSEC